MARNPFEFLDQGSRERTLLILLLALIRKGGGELELSLTDLTAIGDGDSFIKYPADSGTSLVLRFARKGAEAYFLSEAPSTTNPSASAPRSSSSMRPTQPDSLPPPSPPPPSANSSPRHAVHDDLDYALREEEMAQRAQAAARKRQQEARIAEGALPWRTVKPQ